MGASNYKIRKFDQFTITVTGAPVAVSKVIKLPHNRGKNGFTFYIKPTAAAACDLKVEYEPAFCDNEQSSQFEASYVTPSGVTLSTLKILVTGSSSTNFTSQTITSAATYMCFPEMGADCPWDSIELKFTVTSTATIDLIMAND